MLISDDLFRNSVVFDYIMMKYLYKVSFIFREKRYNFKHDVNMSLTETGFFEKRLYCKDLSANDFRWVMIINIEMAVNYWEVCCRVVA